MSLKSILASIGHAVSSVWHALIPNAQSLLILAEGAAQTLKTAVDLDVANIIGRMAGTGGVAMENKLRALMPTIIADLKVPQELIVPGSLEQTLLNINQKIKFSKDSDWNMFWHNMGILIADDFTDGSLAFGELIHLIEWVHENKPPHPVLATAA